MNSHIQKKCTEKILQSKEFTGSKIYQNYLTYLVEAASTKRELKETTIALEFFEKDASFNPAEDTIVRSHTYNLRKKIETYYLKEGKDDRYRLVIPKGHYEVKFVTDEENNLTTRNLYNKILKHKLYILIIVILSVFLTYFILQNRTLKNDLAKFNIVDKTDPIWQEYLQSDFPILIATGDHFFFNEYSETYENLLAIRDGNINSIDDLREFNARQLDRRIQPADEPYFPYHSIWSLPPILSLLNSSNRKPILRKSSSLSPQMLNEYNIIFLGSIKTLYILKHLVANSHFRFEISPHQIEYMFPNADSTQLFETSLHSHGQNDDLVLTLKLPGPENNSIFIIASYHSLGAPEVANYLVNLSTRNELENIFRKKYNKVPQYFEILFRVTGIDKTAYNAELLIYNEIIKGEY
jgi:hypothetical protein